MKYTPEELYGYCTEKGLLLALHNALNEEVRGFRHSMMPAHLSLDGRTLIVETCTGIKTAANLDDPEFCSPEPPVLGDVVICTYVYNGQGKILFCEDSRPLPDNRSSAEWTETAEEEIRELWGYLFVMFLAETGTDTKGRLKALLREGEKASIISEEKEELLESFENYAKAEASMYTGINPDDVIYGKDEDGRMTVQFPLDNVTGMTLVAGEVFWEMVSEPDFPEQMMDDELWEYIGFDPYA